MEEWGSVGYELFGFFCPSNRMFAENIGLKVYTLHQNERNRSASALFISVTLA